MLLHLLLCCLSIHLSTACISIRPPRPPRPPTQPPAPTQPPTPYDCKCGAGSQDGSKIVGGQNAQKNEYPWQVGLVSKNRRTPFCGGSLISSRTVLTAAHCRTSVSSFDVVVGEHNVNSNDGEQRISPSTWINHPDYNDRTVNNDFAIIHLSRDVTFSDAMFPVCLPKSSSSNFDNKDAIVTGWGTLYSNGPQPSILNEVATTIISNTACTASDTAYSTSDITEFMMCATRPNKDSCQGDSGGPLVSKEDGAYSLAGVVSWGFGCAQDDAPGVYARVTSQLSWIQSNMQGDTCPRADIPITG